VRCLRRRRARPPPYRRTPWTRPCPCPCPSPWRAPTLYWFRGSAISHDAEVEVVSTLVECVSAQRFQLVFLRLVGSSHEVSEVSNNTTQEQNSCTNIKFNKGFEMRRTVVFSPRTRCAPRSRHLRRVGPPRIKMPRRVPSGGGRAVADSRFLRSSHAK
jgi:hypothetical protein